MAIEVFAPAKINLTLHVTGQRDDGYHLLDSLVSFADIGDRLTVAKADEMRIDVTGPFAKGVPTDRRNLCWQAAELFGETVAITLEKNLPHAAGIGGGSSDAAAVLKAMEQLFDRPFDGDALLLGADIPVCQIASATRMQGIGEVLSPIKIPPLEAILVNPGVSVPTPRVFKGLERKNNSEMDMMPKTHRSSDFWTWLADQRNDLEAPAIAAQPIIADVLRELSFLGARIVRMSGSGATCFGLFEARGHHEAVYRDLKQRRPEWWVEYATLT
ncbi:MAG: 4-(cytidine 5'-diphospho)-2-C-methyl-D-erythritol kinase [Pelagimonas sp.]|uniref:4-(cytidine 5'-diphospho)-2-C-methyl-D-erythritol kinase n=1 Tax=Pelagimonas sp. TaxID=2073170 RepID=UPI003D6AEF54